MGTGLAQRSYNESVQMRRTAASRRKIGAAAMETLIRFMVIGVLVAIVASLGSALFYLARGRGDSRKMVRALTVRVGLSLALFILLMIAWYTGLISPHDVEPGR
jgi:membrane protease YdiL (CAAX protease family)